MISKIDKKGEDEVEIVFEDVSTTFVDPLVDYILQEDTTAAASYVVDHYLKGPLRMTVKGSKGDPEELIGKAVDQLTSDIDRVRLDLEKGK
jgi:DNA-directed RNA polymerase subunit L